jgi:hypothetical protein
VVSRARGALLALAAAVTLSCVTSPAAAPAPPATQDAPAARGEDGRAAIRPGPEDGFLAPNAQDVDGVAAYVHFTEADMPLRVDVELPRLAARYASREETDAAVVEAIRMWETAIRPVVPWFRIEIVRDDPDAHVQVAWKTRISGGAAGWGGTSWRASDGRLEVRGRLEYATKPCLAISCQLDLGELRRVVAHEFGHTLGLGHCLDCDSAMNYSWETRERVLVTETDARTIRALYAIPNGTRVDGTLLIPLRSR